MKNQKVTRPNENHVVIVGGGFAGVEAAISLRKKKHRVTLVSNRDYFFIYPISIWIPVGKIPFNSATLSLTKLSKKYGFELVVDELVNVKGAENKIVLKNQELDYNYLLLAVGAGKMKHKGLEHIFSICGQPEQSLEMKKRFDELVVKGEGRIAVGFGGNPKDKSGVRGGPAFEILFNMVTELKRRKLYDKFKITFFAPMERPGNRMGKKGFEMLEMLLEKENIEQRVGKKITGFESNGIHVEDGSFIESDLTMFIPATNGWEFFQTSDIPLNEAGFIKIDNNCKVDGFDNIYAAGDVAAIEGPEWRAKQGHMAVVMGKTAAYNIGNDILGKKQRRGYQEHLNILCIMDTGNGAAFIFRDTKREIMIPMPVVGHWLKILWGWHYKLTRSLGI